LFAWNQDIYANQASNLTLMGMIAAAVSLTMFWINGRLGDPSIELAERMAKKVMS